MSAEKSKKPGKVDREQLIAAIRAASEAGGGERLFLDNFLKNAKMRTWDIWRNFPKWRDALKAAGVEPARNPRVVDDEQLLADWGKVARKLGHTPAFSDYVSFGQFHATTFKKRFGAPWGKIVAAFRSFAMKNQEWADVLAMLPEPGQECTASKKKRRVIKRDARAERLVIKQARGQDRQISGDPLYMEGISHAPVNETGVIMLFGAMAAKLGFMVESVRANFPDCQAKRRIGPDAWVTLRIEFEYESRNFRDHGHLAEGCDMIVCWVHNWTDCPERLKVVALSEEVARLRRERLMLAF